jgi:hypothetical protein
MKPEAARAMVLQHVRGAAIPPGPSGSPQTLWP